MEEEQEEEMELCVVVGVPADNDADDGKDRKDIRTRSPLPLKQANMGLRSTLHSASLCAL